jgi:membrane protein YdbS with pleckstrin-like domain
LAEQDWLFVVVSPGAAAIVLLVIVLVFIAPPLIRKYNRWVIERARQQI